jgi:hypothetical protein
LLVFLAQITRSKGKFSIIWVSISWLLPRVLGAGRQQQLQTWFGNLESGKKLVTWKTEENKERKEGRKKIAAFSISSGRNLTWGGVVTRKDLCRLSTYAGSQKYRRCERLYDR